MNYDGTRICGVPDNFAAEQVCAFPRHNPTIVGWYLTGILPNWTAEAMIQAGKAAWAMWERKGGVIARYYERGSDAVNDLGQKKIHGIVATGVGRTAPLGTRFGVLAWSEMPCGKLRLVQAIDAADTWTAIYDLRLPIPANVLDLVRTWGHENGHALGIDHIEPGNLLQANYSSGIGDLRSGDVRELQRRYGPPVLVPVDPPPSPSSPSGGIMDFLFKMLLNAFRSQLQKWIDDGTLAKYLQELLNSLLAGQIKNIADLETHSSAAATQHLTFTP